MGCKYLQLARSRLVVRRAASLGRITLLTEAEEDNHKQRYSIAPPLICKEHELLLIIFQEALDKMVIYVLKNDQDRLTKIFFFKSVLYSQYS